MLQTPGLGVVKVELYPDRSFSTALDILNTDTEVLRSAGLSRSKTIYLKDLATKVLEGLPTLEELEAMGDKTVIQPITLATSTDRHRFPRLYPYTLLPLQC
jgi:hypothetical protein